MDDALSLFNNRDEAVCRCPRCVDSQALWPDWATPSSDWRLVETIDTKGRL